MILSHCPELEIASADDLDGKRWFILGNAFQADPSLPSPPGQVATLSGEDILRATRTWAGRWVLIGSRVIVPDATGLFGIFYVEQNKYLFISSSLAILKTRLDKPTVARRHLGWYGMNWFPPPNTKLSGVMALMPDQILSIETGHPTRLKRTLPETFRNLSTDNRAKLLLLFLKHVLRQAVKTRPKIYLALTAGLDSRTSLGVALDAGLEPEVITIHHPRISTADRLIPQQIAKRLDLKYTYLRPGASNSQKRALYDAHTLSNSHDADRYFFAQGAFDYLIRDSWLLRSAIWEIGRAIYPMKLEGISWQDAKRQPEKIVRKFGNVVNVRNIAAELRQWIEWREENPEPMDWRDAFYRDQRIGGWLSALEQSLDLLDARSFQLVNCSIVFDILLSETEEARYASVLSKRILEISNSALAAFPTNPEMDSHVRLTTRRFVRFVMKARGEIRNVVG